MSYDAIGHQDRDEDATLHPSEKVIDQTLEFVGVCKVIGMVH